MECKECGEPIDERRLAAKPGTQYCLPCQKERESTGKSTKTRIEIHQEISGWQCEGVIQTIIPGTDE